MQILTRNQVIAALGVSATTLWRLERDGAFPPPIRLSPRRIGWPAATVERWLEQKLDEAANG